MTQKQVPVVGWLATPGSDDRWPGVLLHRDAFVVAAPPDLLHHPVSGLSVQLGPDVCPVAEVRIITGPDQGSAPVTAMIRLVHEVPGTASIRLDRSAVLAGWSAGGTTWDMLRDMGVRPTQWPQAPGRRLTVDLEPGPIAVKTIYAAPADWCTIFWWLC